MTMIAAQVLPSRVVPTDEDLQRLHHESGVEFAHGQIVEKPVSIASSEAEVTIASLLRMEASKDGAVRVFGSSMGYQCFPDEARRFRKPDVSAVRAERLVGVDPQDGFISFSPDLAVEVISPNDLAYDVKAKIEEYLAAGFPLIWIVYPHTRTVDIFRGDGSSRQLRDGDEITGESLLPEFRCKVSAFFVRGA